MSRFGCQEKSAGDKKAGARRQESAYGGLVKYGHYDALH
jgi:hypothetical protein